MEKLDFSVIRVNGPVPDPSTISTEGIIEDLWSAYLDSMSSSLPELEAAAMSFEAGKDIEENAARIRRILHSIKGESGMCGVMDIYTLCHEAEFAFEELGDNSSIADMVLKVKDWIEMSIQYISKGSAIAKEDKQAEPAESKKDKPKLETLVIEDDYVCRKGLKRLLDKYCKCTFAVNGRKGFELFLKALDEGKPYQLITLDIMMPEMDGHQTLEAIRKTEKERGIDGLDGVKVIMTTAQEENEHVFGAFREGCEAYVIKPAANKLHDEMVKLGLLDASMIYSIKD